MSFSLQEGVVHLSAVYRNHDFISRAYGNYVGLGRVLRFVARQSGFPIGELTCLSSSATAELGHGAGMGRGALEELARNCACGDEGHEMSEIEALVESLRHAAGTASVIRAGVDRVELDEFQRTIDAAGQPFLERVFTGGELSFASGRIERLADRFAAKEAVAKVLGTGFRGLGPSEIEIVMAPNGQPHAELHGRAGKRDTTSA